MNSDPEKFGYNNPTDINRLLWEQICMYMYFVQEPTQQIIKSSERNKKSPKHRGEPAHLGRG
jgi:hypothetical protein